MEIRKIKLGNVNYFESLKETFIKTIIKELYNNKINDCDYDTLETRITFLNGTRKLRLCFRRSIFNVWKR